jgi:hypothetical protein
VIVVDVNERRSVILWCFISVFLIFWVGFDILNAVNNGVIKDLRTSNPIHLSKNPFWFSVLFFVKCLVIIGSAYFVVFYGFGVKKIKGKSSKKRK